MILYFSVQSQRRLIRFHGYFELNKLFFCPDFMNFFSYNSNARLIRTEISGLLDFNTTRFDWFQSLISVIFL